MGDWLVDALLVPMAEELAQELGVQIPFGEMGKLAGTGNVLRMRGTVRPLRDRNKTDYTMLGRLSGPLQSK